MTAADERAALPRRRGAPRSDPARRPSSKPCRRPSPGPLPDRQALARQRLGRAYVDSLAIRYTGYRQLSKISKGELPGPEASAGKLAGTRVALDLADPPCGCWATTRRTPPPPTGVRTWQHLQAVLPGMAIAGGTDEVLRNIIGERVLGLPPEPRADKA